MQFVCVELLKGELSGENAVCLTFKNISKVTPTALEIHFKCKGVDGIILCEDAFEYREIEVKPGESFGMDDAVFVTQKAITSVDVVLKNVYSGKKGRASGCHQARPPAGPAPPESGAGKGTGKPDEPHRPQVYAAGVRERLVLCLRFLPPEGRGHGLLHRVRL